MRHLKEKDENTTYEVDTGIDPLRLFHERVGRHKSETRVPEFLGALQQGREYLVDELA